MRNFPEAFFWCVLGATTGTLGLFGQVLVPPVVTEQPADVVTNVGGAASFRVVTGEPLPMGYRFQWSLDGKAVAGATRDVLVIARVVSRDAGRYSVQIGGAQGTATSASALLTVQPAPAVPIVDPAFRGDASLTGNPTAMLPLADGRVLLATSARIEGVAVADLVTTQLVRLLADGRIDPSFRRGSAVIDEFEPQSEIYPPRITQLLVQPDGKLLVAGCFIAFNGTPCRGLVRLTVTGEVDSSFAAPVLSASSDSRGIYGRIALQADGKILLLADNVNGLVRLLANGQVDSAFAPSNLDGPVIVVAVGSGGRVFVGTGGVRGPGGSGRVNALREDGSADPSFVPYTCDPVQHLFGLAGGGVAVSTQYDRGPFISPRFPATTFRLRADGSRDPEFPQRDKPLLTAPSPSGSLLLNGKLIAADGVAETSPYLGVGYAESFGVGGDDRYFSVFDGDGRLWLAGPFAIYNGVATSRVVHLNLGATEALTPPRVLAAWTEPATVRLGEAITARVAPIGSGPLTYTWSVTGLGPMVTTEPSVTYLPYASGSNGGFSVTVANSAGTSASVSVPVTVLPGALQIVDQPRRVSLTVGRWGVMGVRLAATSARSGQSQWRRNGVVLMADSNGAAGPIQRLDFDSLTFGFAQPEHAGTYTVTISNEFGQSVTSDPIVVTVGDGSRFTNLSTRAQIGLGDQAAILGFVIPPGQYREVLLRGIGPSLAPFGVTGALAEARLDLFDGQGRAVIRSKSWGTGLLRSATSADFEKSGAFSLVAGSHDAGLSIGLAPGSYTARLSGVGDTTGVGLIELYEIDNFSDRLINLSSRVFVGGGRNAIAGFAIRGPVGKRVLIRATGPALAGFGVVGTLANPRLEIRDEAGRTVVANDDWQNQSEPAAAATVFTAAASVGAFSLANESRDAALVVTLPAGNYSAVVTGTGAESGLALVEVYELP